MRRFMRCTTLVGLFVLSALAASSTASAIALFTSPPSNGNPLVGDTFTIELRMDTEGETQITSLFASVIVDPTRLSFIGGTSPGAILFNFSTYVGLSRASQPVDGVPGDAPGRIRAANFVITNPNGSGVASANVLLATLTFQVIETNLYQVSPLLVVGDDEITVAQSSVTGSVTVVPGVPFPVPEPSTALLLGLGMTCLSMTRQRSIRRHRTDRED